MYARMISVTIRPGHEDDLMELVTSRILPIAREMDGFIDAVALIDRPTGRWIMITLWTNAHCLEAAETSGHIMAQLAHAAPLITGPAIRETFEVRIPPLAHASDAG